ncbi:DoxX family membrane protein [Streptomyces sp. RB6PN25]|uniref:DoxX family membrane protein n=1 Tax=Streptomyces humicola TaxID=2953240 RepID=A0ABT1Q259_9ACTN|nr:DoxX family protein [Streptomyces humicola]MCQ4084006.1 DoxX family membrane protein [Streptomyces humicola]
MSVDTRTPRSPSGGRTPGFEEQTLNTVKVPCDPAQVIVNHASFRVRLGSAAPPPRYGADDTTPMPVIPTSVRSAAEVRMPGRRRAAPVVWSGQTAPGDPAATTQLLQAVRGASATQLLPRPSEELHPDNLDDGMPPVRPAVVAPRRPVIGAPAPPPGDLLGAVRLVRGAGAGAYGEHGDHDEYDPYAGDGYDGYDGYSGDEPFAYADADADADADEDAYADVSSGRRRGAEAVRHAWYPGRRMNLGVVLLPLRIFLGCISIYAGMGKLCDPVYFDGGRRGSMVQWLSSLHPWSVAEPLRAAALDHPVGAGLTVAFLQIAVGVLTIMGLWQRVAAAIGAILSVALLVTVSWRTVPVYNAPDIIYLAAWSPLVIAGAPVYSADARLAGEAWRTLGPRAPLWDLRRRVLRRGAFLVTLVGGGTLLLGALLGSAVRSAETVTNRPDTPLPTPTNNLPGSPLPQPSLTHGLHARRHSRSSASTSASKKAVPGLSSTATPGGAGEGGTLGGYGEPGQQQTVQVPPAPAPTPRTTSPAASASTGGGSGSTSGGGSLGGLLGSKSTTGWLLGMPGERRPAAASGEDGTEA